MSAQSSPISVQDAQTGAEPTLPRQILVAEDEHLLARSLAADLSELGYTVIGPAPNGLQALEMARKLKPDLALLDIRMPGMDGLSAAEVLHAELGIPVVFLSAYSDPEYLQAGARLGVFGYLLKPVSLDQLRVTLTVAWSRYLKQQTLSGEVARTRQELENRKIIERAKGIIMKVMSLGEEEAMQKLHKHARDSRKPMVEVAKAILDTQGLIFSDKK